MTMFQFFSELAGTALLLLLGGGVVANNVLTKTNGFGGGFLMVNFGWGIGVMAGVLAAAASGAHLNPAVTLGFFLDPKTTQFADGIDKSFVTMLVYFVAQMLGAMAGALLCWLSYKEHFDQTEEAANKLGVFSTGPGIRKPGWNLVTEIIATFVLVIGIMMTPKEPNLGPIVVTLLVVGIGASLGGPTGYAINPARDLGPRIMHAILPIKGKGSSDWGYAWVPVVGPLLGGALAAAVHVALMAMK